MTISKSTVKRMNALARDPHTSYLYPDERDDLIMDLESQRQLASDLERDYALMSERLGRIEHHLRSKLIVELYDLANFASDFSGDPWPDPEPQTKPSKTRRRNRS